jgi:hypothetical protein
MEEGGVSESPIVGRDLSVGYGGQNVIEHLDIRIPAREWRKAA